MIGATPNEAPYEHLSSKHKIVESHLEKLSKQAKAESTMTDGQKG